ncbi:MAG: PAS domain-containing protein [Nitrospiraceae bacterium]|nr:PAS domain-containing protein [Nitrospiraceae bacterium]
MLQRVDRLELVMLVALPLLAAVTLAIRFGRPEGWQQHRQLLWVLVGLLAGYLPFLVLYVMPFVLGLAWWPGWLTLAGVLPLILVPLTFAYAILKYKLWDIGIILRDSISYSLTALIGLLGFSLINLLIQRGLTAEMTLARNMLAFTAGLAIAGVMVPTRSAIAAGLEKLQYRGHYGHRSTLNELGYELLRERDLEHLCRTVVDGLTEGLAVPRAALYLSQGGVLLAVEPDPGMPSQLDPDTLGEDFWSRDVEAISAIALPGQEPSTAQRFFVAGYRYAFPLVVRGCRVGLALMSYKEPGEPLNSEDIDLARGLLNQAALALENAQLLEEVQRQLTQVTKLEEHNRGIIESSPVGLAVLDDDERIVLANQAFTTLAGMLGATGSVVGHRFEEIIPVRPLPVTGSGALEVSFCDLSGQEHHLLISQASYQVERQRQLSIVVVQDRSAQIELEMELKEKEQLASLGMLAAGWPTRSTRRSPVFQAMLSCSSPTPARRTRITRF